jgi:hypothetical protein
MKTKINDLPKPTQETALDMAVQQWFDLMLATIEYKKNKPMVTRRVKEWKQNS